MESLSSQVQNAMIFRKIILFFLSKDVTIKIFYLCLIAFKEISMTSFYYKHAAGFVLLV